MNLFLFSLCPTSHLSVIGEVIFDRNHLDEPPDFIFSTQDDLTDFNPSIEKLTVSLSNDFVSVSFTFCAGTVR